MKRKPKPVKTWAFAVQCPDGFHFIQSINESGQKRDIFLLKRLWQERGYRCGPIVRIEVPAPMDEKS